MNTALLLGVILALALFGSRLFVVVAVATAMCFFLYVPSDTPLLELDRIITKMESLTTKNVFLSIPFFIASGSIMTRGGIARRLTDLARALVGWLPGGLAVASIVACIVFAAISGSSPVTLVAVGAVMYPAMLSAGYPKRFTIGLLSSAGSLGSMVPPAIAMLVYAISVQDVAPVDPSDLFFAGLVPALMIAGMLAIYSVWTGLKVPGSRQPFDAGNLWVAAKAAGWALMLPAIVLGGIYGGVFTPTEAGAVALMASVIVSVFVHGDVKLAALPSIFAEAATLIGSLVLIVVLAFGLNDFLAYIEAAERIRTWVEGADLSAWEFMLLVNLILIVLGALMDSISATLVFAPMLAPVAVQHYGIDPIHFGIVFVVNMEIGYIAPPVATNLFVAAAIFREPFVEVAKAIVPTLLIICVALGVLIYVPTLSTGPLALRDGGQVYTPFPWAGKGAGTAAPTPDRPLTLEEMMKQADAAAPGEAPGEAEAPGAAEAPAAPDRPLTLDEMMKKAQEQVEADEAAPAPPDGTPTAPAPVEAPAQ